MPSKSPSQDRVGAERVVNQLRNAGYEAFLVGGCVRDKLLGREPKEYDIATSATPDEVIRTFKRTVPVGAQFGVILVLVPEGEYEVATFREETTYSDGRRPDSVTFVSAREDVLRRDFTINGLLEDPKTGAIKDFVGGEDDLKSKLIRAIGDPNARFAEDHLRILRALRFAATLEFDIDSDTLIAITALAHTVTSVSSERIHNELQRMFEEGNPGRAYTLLSVTGVLRHILPEVESSNASEAMFKVVGECDLAMALAIMLGATTIASGNQIAQRLKLSNHQRALLLYLLDNRTEFDCQRSHANAIRFVRHEHWPTLANLVHAERTVGGQPLEAVQELMALRQSLSDDQLNPPRLLTGNDLKSMGLQPGPQFKSMLTALETEQLEGRITTREAAEAFILAFNASSAAD